MESRKMAQMNYSQSRNREPDVEKTYGHRSGKEGRWNILGNWSWHIYTAVAKSLQSCPTLCDPIDGSPPGSPISGILKARTLEWVAISSNAWEWKMKVKLLSHVRLLATLWTVAHQAPPSMGLSRQEYWSGVPLPSLIYTLLCIKYWVSRQLFTVLFHPHQEIL